MNQKLVLILMTVILMFGMTLNYTKEIIKTGTLQIERARNIAEQYNKRTRYLDSLLDEISCP